MASYFGAPMFVVETQTARGIRSLANAITIYIVVAILALILPYAMYALAGQVPSDYGPSFLAFAIGFLALFCGLLALYLVLIILAINGFWSVHKGKTEYGIAHEKDMGRAMTFFIAAIAFFFASMAVSFASLVVSLGSLAGPAGGTSTPSPVFAVVSAVLGMLFSVMIALILFYMVKAFTPSEKQNFGIAAAGLYVTAAVLSGIYALSLAFLPASSVLDSYALRLVPRLIGGLLLMISLVLFLILYRDAHRRLKSHVIKPVWETMAAQYPIQAQEYRWQPPPSP